MIKYLQQKLVEACFIYNLAVVIYNIPFLYVSIYFSYIQFHRMPDLDPINIVYEIFSILIQ